MKKKGSFLPHRHLKDLLVSFMGEMKAKADLRPDLILEEWARIIDPKWQGMTKASSFDKGTLVIHVKNAALYSLLIQHEGSKLLKKLQDKYPESGIKKLKFCIG
jgi:hypothetical protein